MLTAMNNRTMAALFIFCFRGAGDIVCMYFQLIVSPFLKQPGIGLGAAASKHSGLPITHTKRTRRLKVDIQAYYSTYTWEP
jgi:hypothetical protein